MSTDGSVVLQENGINRAREAPSDIDYYEQRFLSSLIGADGDWSVLRSAQISARFVLVNCPDDQFIEHMIPSAIKLNRFTQVPILFLDGLVVRRYVERELAFLRVCLLELKADGRDWLGLCAFQQSEFEVVAVAFVFEGFQIIASVRDQSALHPKITDRAIEFRLGCLEFSFRRSHIRFYAAYLGLNSCDFSRNCG